MEGQPIGLDLPSDCKVTLTPSISAYVGGDIVSGIVNLGIDINHHERILMIDIGTNGEIVYKGPEGCYSTSTAAGPALEGMNISCGMRAHVGAVERLDMDSDGKWTLEVIGNIEPQGFCGSGLLDGVAKLLDKGFIGKTGRFNKKT